jgi:hypothetical protein
MIKHLVIPILVAIVSCFFLNGSVKPLQDANALISIGSGVAAIGATMLGFMLAALAILASISGSILVKQMAANGYYDDLVDTIFASCTVFFVCLIVGFVLMFLSNVKYPQWSIVFIIGLHIVAVSTLLDVGRKFWLVLGNLKPVS